MGEETEGGSVHEVILRFCGGISCGLLQMSLDSRCIELIPLAPDF